MRPVLAGALVLIALGAAQPALADRPPSASERTAVESKLRALGFVSWEDIELDDDGPYWEIDDARNEAGQRYDVKLAEGSLEELDRDLED